MLFGHCGGRVWVRELSLSRDLLTNDIALFSIVVIISGTETFAFDGKYKSQKNINIKMFLQNLKCCSTTTKDLLAGKRYFQCYFDV